MVLDNLLPASWLEKRMGYAFLIGVIASLLGIVAAKLLFGANSGLASVVFTALLLTPSLRKLFAKEERQEEREKKYSFRRLFWDSQPAIKAYLGVFLGVYVLYYLACFVSLQFGWDVTSMFREQVFLDPVISGRAAFDVGTFWGILSNNWWVLLACFIISLLAGDGATFFIVWNASAWAVIFAFRAVAAASYGAESVVGAIILMTLITLPHMLLEGLSYIVAGVAGSVLSDSVVTKSKEIKNFLFGLAGAVLVFALFSWFLRFVGDGPLATVLRILVAVGLLALLKQTFTLKRHQEVFLYNYRLFLFALGLFILGAIVETFVLTNSTILANLYFQASMFALG